MVAHATRRERTSEKPRTYREKRIYQKGRGKKNFLERGKISGERKREASLSSSHKGGKRRPRRKKKISSPYFGKEGKANPPRNGKRFQALLREKDSFSFLKKKKGRGRLSLSFF